jgi:predicted transporter
VNGANLAAVAPCPACCKPIAVPITLVADPPAPGATAISMRVVIDQERCAAVLEGHVAADPAAHAHYGQ